ncbi:sugar transferase, glycosyl transferase family 4 [Priestia megaterium]|uniref:glycosyltransferase family 4 protein n=1 Tax=Priestia megaterium TaxID=1404 RepID=UPI000E125BF1|nr:glycosyltransferase family 4 protein [Priestia megaterium]SUV02275.1 sugar transferase, glycosyl transferase family 4 [Priestia megaterium]
MNKKVLIIRNFASKVNIDSYNLQEIGLGKAFVNKGFECDVIYYHDSNSFEEVIYESENRNLTIKWTKAIKFMSNSIYYSLLKKSRLDQYDIIISTEYNQVMTLLLSVLCGDKVYLYHGPYKDNNHNFLQKIYDQIAAPIITKKIAKTFTKSNLANDFLKTKGFKNVKTVGVGLDIDKLNASNDKNRFPELKETSSTTQNLLYVGVLEDRRNIEFMFNVFSKLVQVRTEARLTLVGNGKKEDLERYFQLAKELNIDGHITHIKQVKQSELKALYQKSDLFLFPTSYDIFGMVLLESMYFHLPVISTLNGGSETLINGNNGMVLDKLNEDLWVEKIYNVLCNLELRKQIGENAHTKILTEFTWDKIVNKMILP